MIFVIYRDHTLNIFNRNYRLYLESEIGTSLVIIEKSIPITIKITIKVTIIVNNCNSQFQQSKVIVID
jgi:hypothetical protein